MRGIRCLVKSTVTAVHEIAAEKQVLVFEY